jgi:hypothetical protein
MSGAEPVHDFWLSSGHHLLDHDTAGRLVLTDEFLKVYLARPEVVPPADACIVERAVYQRLTRTPRTPVDKAEIATIADRDARENWRHLIAFRDALLATPTLEAAYLKLARAQHVTTPPLFLNQLVQVIARNMLDGERDPFELRAAEMLFRQQRLTLKDGVMLLADEELVDGADVKDPTSPLVAIFGDAHARNLDVMTPDNAEGYFGHSDAFHLVMDFRHGQRARDAFARVIAKWVRHMLGLAVSVTVLDQLQQADWSWFVGLDQDGTRIGNALWNGEEPADFGRDRIVALFALTFDEASDMLPRVAGKPVYLILGMTPNRIVRLKPPNLLTGLPVRAKSA